MNSLCGRSKSFPYFCCQAANALERVNHEIKRRTYVARLFPNETSLLRLVTARLAEMSEEWEFGKSTSTWE